MEVLLPPNYNVLEAVITGINDKTRARMAGFAAPTTLGELFTLIPKMEVIRNLQQPVYSNNNAPRNNWYHNAGGSFTQHTAPPRVPHRPRFNPTHHGTPYHYQPTHQFTPSAPPAPPAPHNSPRYNRYRSPNAQEYYQQPFYQDRNQHLNGNRERKY